MEVEVEDVGPALRYATAKINRVQRSDGGFSSGGQGGGGSEPADDPWATGAPAANFDEPPF
jgi:single-strand DNA-binding protein